MMADRLPPIGDCALSGTGGRDDRDVHLLGLEAEHDEHLGQTVHECETDTDLDDLGLAELRPQLRLLCVRWGARLVEIRIRKDQRTLVTLGQTAVGPLIGDLLNEVLGEPFLPRDREAQLLSKPAVGDGCVAKSRHFLDGLFHLAVAPEVTVQVAVRRGREVLVDRVDRFAVGIAKARRGGHQRPPVENTRRNFVKPSIIPTFISSATVPCSPSSRCRRTICSSVIE